MATTAAAVDQWVRTLGQGQMEAMTITLRTMGEAPTWAMYVHEGQQPQKFACLILQSVLPNFFPRSYLPLFGSLIKIGYVLPWQCGLCYEWTPRSILRSHIHAQRLSLPLRSAGEYITVAERKRAIYSGGCIGGRSQTRVFRDKSSSGACGLSPEGVPLTDSRLDPLWNPQ